MFLKKTSITRNKLYNSLIASKIEIDLENIEYSCKKITNQLSSYKLASNKNKIVKSELIRSPTVYNLESFYRCNTNDRI